MESTPAPSARDYSYSYGYIDGYYGQTSMKEPRNKAEYDRGFREGKEARKN